MIVCVCVCGRSDHLLHILVDHTLHFSSFTPKVSVFGSIDANIAAHSCTLFSREHFSDQHTSTIVTHDTLVVGYTRKEYRTFLSPATIAMPQVLDHVKKQTRLLTRLRWGHR